MDNKRTFDNYADIEAKKCISIILSIVSLAFSSLLMFPCLPRILSNEELQFDYIGAIVGILALLVTVLIGWNIYQLVDMKDIKKNYATSIDAIKNEFDKRVNDVETDNFIETTALYNILDAKIKNSPASYLAACINSFYDLKEMKRFSTFKCKALDFPLLFIKSLLDENLIKDYSELSKDINKRAMDYFIFEFGKFNKKEREEKYKGVEQALIEMAKYTRE